MQRIILIAFFIVVWQFGHCQPECFRNNDTTVLSAKSRAFLREINPFYQKVPDDGVHILPLRFFKDTESKPDTSSDELELLVYQQNVRIRALFLDDFGFTKKEKVFDYLKCAGEDTTLVIQFDGCLGYTTTFAEYAYSQLRNWLTPEEREELRQKWLQTSNDESLRSTLLNEIAKSNDSRQFLLSLIANHPKDDVYLKLLQEGNKSDRIMLVKYAEQHPKNAHDLMIRYPDESYIPYAKKLLEKAPNSPYTSDLLSIANAIDSVFSVEIHTSICQKLDPTKIYPFGQNIYNSDYYRGLNEQDKHQLLVKLLPSLNTIDSIDIDYLVNYQREAFDRAISKRLMSSFKDQIQVYVGDVIDQIFVKYTEHWTNEKQEVCRKLCAGINNKSSVLATIALIEHNDPQTSELLYHHFQMDTSNIEAYNSRHYYSIDAMSFSNDSILFQKVGAILLQQFLKNELHSDPFNYLYILDRSLIPGFYELLLKDMEKGPLTYKHAAVASFLLTKNNSTINKLLVANYQKIYNQTDSDYYNTEIGFYLTEYGLLNR